MLIKCTEKINFFSEMIHNQESDKHEECCKAMNYKLGQPGEIIVKEGSVGQIFYIILKGSVGIYKESIEIPNSISNSISASISHIKEDNSKLGKKKGSLLLPPTTNQLRRFSSQVKENPSSSDNQEVINKIKLIKTTTQIKENLANSDNPENWNKIKVLKSGDAFGELSLIDGRPRAATVICEQECHLAILEKQYFDKILSKNILKKNNLMTCFYNQILCCRVELEKKYIYLNFNF